MAILHGFKVAVVVDGKELTEYADEPSEDSSTQPYVITKYIEAVSDARFKTTLTFHDPHFKTRYGIQGVSAKCTIDGYAMGGCNLRKDDEREGRRSIDKNNEPILQPFLFSDVKLCENALTRR